MNIRTFSCFVVTMFGAVACALFAPCRARAAEAAVPAPVVFSRDIAPALVKNCNACHGAREPKGNFQVTSFQSLMKAGESGSASVTAGKPEESELFNLIATSDKDSRMPKDGDPLPAEQIALVKRWIMEGAKFDGPNPAAALSEIIPRTAQPDPPAAYRRPVPITAVAFSATGEELAVSGYHEVTLWNVQNGALLRRIKNVAERVYGLSFSHDGKLLASAGGTPGQSGEVKAFDPATGNLVREFGSSSDVIFKAVFNPAGTKLATAGADRSIRIFDVATGKQDVLIEDHADWVVGLAWSPDGKRLASASRDKTSKVFNAENGESVTTYSGHGDQVFGVAFAADGKHVFTSGMDKRIHAWTPDNGQKSANAPPFDREVLGLAVFADKIFGCSADGTARQFRGDGLTHFRTYTGNNDSVFAIAYHDGGKRVATGSFSGDVKIWKAEDGAVVTSFIAAPGFVPPHPPAAAAPAAAAAK